MGIAANVARMMRQHGASMVLRRRVDEGFDSLSVKGKLTSGSAVDFDGEAGALQRIKISHAEIAGSALPDLLPAEKDQIVVGGTALSIVSVTTLRDGDAIVVHILSAAGPSV